MILNLMNHYVDHIFMKAKKWRKAQDFKESSWVYEIGEAPTTTES